MNEAALGQQLLRLSALLQLEMRARSAKGKELEFIIVNETAQVIAYQQAVLWRRSPTGKETLTPSGAAMPEPGSPYVHWLKQLFAHLTSSAKAATFFAVSASEVPETIRNAWPQWFPPYAFWCPLVFPDGTLAGAVLLGRAVAWQEGEKPLLEMLMSGYAQSLAVQELKPGIPFYKKFWPHRSKRVKRIAIAVVVLLLLPLRVSVLAPADTIAVDPAAIRAPFDGVVANINVKPNQPVHPGQSLLTLDVAQLKAHAQVAQGALDMARAEYSGAAQEALSDVQAKGKLAMLQSRIEQQKAELEYDQNLLKQADIVSPIEGIAVFDDPVALTGKPVIQGERVMLVAADQTPLIEIAVPVADVVTFTPGAEVVFFSNIEPDRPLPATLEFASYASKMTADGILSYHFRARLNDPSQILRLGLKGTAKIYGDRKPLVLWILRRPIALIRQWLAL